MEIAAVFGLNWKLLLIQAVNFGIVLFVLHRFLYRPLLHMIDERRLTIRKGVADAEEAARKLALASDESKRVIREAEVRGNKVLERATVAAKEKEAELLKAAEGRARIEKEEAKREAEATVVQAVEESQHEIARLAVLAAEKILRQKS